MPSHSSWWRKVSSAGRPIRAIEFVAIVPPDGELLMAMATG